MHAMNKKRVGLVRAAKIVSLVLFGLLLGLGILLVFWSDDFAVPLRFLFGVLALLMGGAKIFGYFSNDLYRIAFQFDFAIGTLVGIFGIFLLAHPDAVMPYLTTAVVSYILLDGLIRVQTAVDAYHFGMPFWYALLLGAILLVLGALAMFLFAEQDRMIWLGAMLMADALLGVFVTMYTVRVRVRKKQYSLTGE